MHYFLLILKVSNKQSIINNSKERLTSFKFVYSTVLLRNNLTENMFGTHPERIPKCVPFAFHFYRSKPAERFHATTVLETPEISAILKFQAISCRPKSDNSHSRSANIFKTNRQYPNENLICLLQNAYL